MPFTSPQRKQGASVTRLPRLKLQNPGNLGGLEQFMQGRVKIAQHDAAAALAQLGVQRENFPDDDARHLMNLTEIEVKIWPSAFQHQLVEFINEQVNVHRIEISLCEENEGAILKILYFPLT